MRSIAASRLEQDFESEAALTNNTDTEVELYGIKKRSP